MLAQNMLKDTIFSSLLSLETLQASSKSHHPKLEGKISTRQSGPIMLE